jgi:hypothetical protein
MLCTAFEIGASYEQGLFDQCVYKSHPAQSWCVVLRGCNSDAQGRAIPRLTKFCGLLREGQVTDTAIEMNERLMAP